MESNVQPLKFVLMVSVLKLLLFPLVQLLLLILGTRILVRVNVCVTPNRLLVFTVVIRMVVLLLMLVVLLPLSHLLKFHVLLLPNAQEHNGSVHHKEEPAVVGMVKDKEIEYNNAR